MRKFVIVTLGAVSIAGAWTETSSAMKLSFTRPELQSLCEDWGGNFSSSPGAGYGCAYNDGDSPRYVSCTESGACNRRDRVLPPTKYGSAAGQGAASTKSVSGSTAGKASTASNASGAKGALTAGSTSTAGGTSAAGGASTSKPATKTAPVTVTATVGAGGGVPASGRPPLRQQ
jgi:hypothetical protein